MSMAADSLAALKYSQPTVSSAHLTFESSLTEVQVCSSPDLQTSSPLAFYGALRKKDSISGVPRQVVTSTEALMARPPVLSRRFSRAPMGRPLFMPTVYDEDNSFLASRPLPWTRGWTCLGHLPINENISLELSRAGPCLCNSSSKG
ncbi:hypothetical protein SLA2020_271910, partial [Shorea laevis]